MPPTNEHSALTRRAGIIIFAAGVLALTAGFVGGTNISAPSRSTVAAPAAQAGDLESFDSAKPTVIEGADRRPNTTASDWISYSDHVVVATVRSAIDEVPGDGEVEVGSVLREVILRVDEVLWSSSSAEVDPPDEIEWAALGYTFRDGGERSPMVVAGAPRLEVGHTYILAIDWEPQLCPGFGSGRWRGLGTHSTLAYDQGQIGVGEIEGRSRNNAEAERDAAVSIEKAEVGDYEPPLGDRLVGASADELAELLRGTEPEKLKDYGPEALTCDN